MLHRKEGSRFLPLAILLLGIISCKSSTGPVMPAAGSGDQIFYDVITGPDSTQFGVHAINTDGTGDKLLYLNGQISSAPRKGKLLFVRYIDSRSEDSTAFYLGDVSGGKEQKLFTIEDRNHFAILSPDGRKIIYDDTANQLNIYDILVPVSFRPPLKMELGSQFPVITDDSKTVFAIFNSPIAGLFSMDIQSVNPRFVTSDGMDFFIASEEHRTFDISPDGSKICYFPFDTAHIGGGNGGSNSFQLRLKNISSLSSFSDSNHSGSCDAVIWSPDGGRIAFTFALDGFVSYEKIAVYEVSSGTMSVYSGLNLGSEQAVQSIDWSKDGESLFIVVFDDRKYASQLVKMNARTGDFSIFNTGSNKLGGAYRSRDLGEH